MGGKFYVYEHWRPDTDTCFYVGKGSGRRGYSLKNRNVHHKAITKKLASNGFCLEVRIVVGGLDEHEAFAIEIERIAFWKANNVMLSNMTDGGEGPSGHKHTAEWKAESSRRNKGRKMSLEGRAKIAAGLKGNKNSLGKKKPQHAIDACRKAHIGRIVSPETRAKISATKLANPRVGFTMSEEAIAKIRSKQIGRPKSEETKSKMRKPKTEAHKQKLREANIGKIHSKETRIILSNKAKEQWILQKMKSNLEVGG